MPVKTKGLHPPQTEVAHNPRDFTRKKILGATRRSYSDVLGGSTASESCMLVESTGVSDSTSSLSDSGTTGVYSISNRDVSTITRMGITKKTVSKYPNA